MTVRCSAVNIVSKSTRRTDQLLKTERLQHASQPLLLGPVVGRFDENKTAPDRNPPVGSKVIVNEQVHGSAGLRSGFDGVASPKTCREKVKGLRHH